MEANAEKKPLPGIEAADKGKQAHLFRERCLQAARRQPTNWLDRLLQRLAVAIQEERDLRDHIDTSIRNVTPEAARYRGSVTKPFFLSRAN